MTDDEFIATLRDNLRRSERKVPTSRLNRLWKTGRSAATMATSALGKRLRSGEQNGDGDRDAIARLVAQLGELKGIAMKTGQILGYIDPTLNEQFRGILSVLQTTSPAMPFAMVEKTLREAFGERAEAVLRGLRREPVAIASIGQVHRATLPDGSDVAMKIVHPGVCEAIRGDFRTARSGAVFARVFAPGAGASVTEFIDEARTAMLEECDYVLEAERQEKFRSLFAGDPVVWIPATKPDWCTPTVLTTEWVTGLSLDEFLARSPDQEQRDRFGEALFRFYVGTLYRHGLFHADPHPGNYAFTGDGRLVVYDFGCVRAFDHATVASLVDLAHAVRADDVAAMTDALTRLGARVPSDPKRFEHARKLLRGFFAPMLQPGPSRIELETGLEAREVLRDKRALASLRLPGKFLYLFRLRFGLYAVLARLGTRADWSALEASWARESFPADGDARAAGAAPR
jgi:predicted unusual protein kinase regulating ubiquinone biosynthesis (AarF/ABC1/UbiB family)